jgi:hypothetical protein
MKTLLPTYLRLGPRPRLSCARHFEASGLDRKHWSSAGPIRQIFKDAFAAAGLPHRQAEIIRALDKSEQHVGHQR